MNKIGLIVLVLYSVAGYAKDPSLQKVRDLFQQAPDREESCVMLVDMLAVYNETNNPLLLGYKASATMIMARHVFSPFEKMTYFKRGKSMLEKAVEADEDNVELRFLRFSIQTSIPAFLGYNDEVSADKAFLLRNVFQLSDKPLREMIISYLRGSDRLTDSEKQKLAAWRDD